MENRRARSPDAEWWNYSTATLAYTFAAGIVVGAFGAIAFGEVIPQGPTLTIYLTVVGAMLAATLGWLSGRLGDMQTDRRARRRIAAALFGHVSAVALAAERLLDALEAKKDVQEIVAHGQFTHTLAGEGVKFDSLIDNEEAIVHALRIKFVQRMVFDITDAAAIGSRLTIPQATAAAATLHHCAQPFAQLRADVAGMHTSARFFFNRS